MKACKGQIWYSQSWRQCIKIISVKEKIVRYKILDPKQGIHLWGTVEGLFYQVFKKMSKVEQTLRGF